MWWRRKKPTVDPAEQAAAANALGRARESLGEVIDRNPGDTTLLHEFKKADPYGAAMFEAMKARQQ